MLKEYAREWYDIINGKEKKKQKSSEKSRKEWIHLDRILDCLNMERIFKFEDEKGILFNFKNYYDNNNTLEIE